MLYLLQIEKILKGLLVKLTIFKLVTCLLASTNVGKLHSMLYVVCELRNLSDDCSK